MLYDGAIRFLQTAKDAMERQDLFVQNANLQKAQKIVTELSASLDMKKGGPVAENLFGLYTYCFNEIVEANLLDRVENIDNCLAVLQQLRDSWGELERQQRNPSLMEERLAS